MSKQDVSIVTMAHRRAKASKRDAFAIVRAASKRGELLCHDEIAALYSYFLMPPVKSTVKTDNFAWVVQAATNSDPKFYLRLVEVARGVAYATDGHRLFYADVSLADGAYDVGGNAVDAERFPKYDDVINSTVKNVTDIVEPPFEAELFVGNNGEYHCYDIGGVRINTKYLDEALACEGEMIVRANEEECRVRVNNMEHTRFAIIMGLRKD